MGKDEFNTSSTKHQNYGIEALLSLLVGTTANGKTLFWYGAVFRIGAMTFAVKV